MKRDCYAQACKNILKDPKLSFCFGYVLFGIVNEKGEDEYVKVLHAWNEDEKNVYDFSNDEKIILPKEKYYKNRNVNFYIKLDYNQIADLLKMDEHAGWWCEALYTEKFGDKGKGITCKINPRKNKDDKK